MERHRTGIPGANGKFFQLKAGLNHQFFVKFFLFNPQISTLFTVSKKTFRYASRLIYNEDHYPTYCFGGLYLMTAPTVDRLLDATSQINLIQIEDVVFTGILPNRLNITVHSSEAFCNKQVSFGVRGEEKCDKIF